MHWGTVHSDHQHCYCWYPRCQRCPTIICCSNVSCGCCVGKATPWWFSTFDHHNKTFCLHGLLLFFSQLISQIYFFTIQFCDVLVTILQHIEEEGVSKVLADFNLRYDVTVTLSSVGPYNDFPWLKPSDLMTSMARTGDFKRFLGGKTIQEARGTLELFWKRFRSTNPDHAVFKKHLPNDYHKLVPMYVHGDEGKGFKKRGVLVISFQSPLGYGGRHAPNKQACVFVCWWQPFTII